jgi:hypothetical protein
VRFYRIISKALAVILLPNSGDLFCGRPPSEDRISSA